MGEFATLILANTTVLSFIMFSCCKIDPVAARRAVSRLPRLNDVMKSRTAGVCARFVHVRKLHRP